MTTTQALLVSSLLLAGCGPIAGGVIAAVSGGGSSGGGGVAAPEIAFVASDQHAFGIDPVCGFAAGDVNGDGHDDVVLGRDVGRLDVYLGDGAGGFASLGAQTLPFGMGEQLALGDADGDGDLDLFLATDGVRVLTNDGAGTFTDAGVRLVVSASSSITEAIAVADLDRDGDPDVVATESPFRLGVFRNDGAGAFTLIHEQTVDATQVRLQVADADGDGHPDVLSGGGAFGNPVLVLRNVGLGLLASPEQVAGNNGALSYAVGDVDRDRDLDIVLLVVWESVALNDGTGYFQPPQRFGIGGYMSAMALGDLDGDGDLDLVSAESLRNVVYLNVGRPAFAYSAEFPRPFTDLGDALALHLIDVDGDGDLDLLRVTGSQQEPYPCRLYLNEGLRR